MMPIPRWMVALAGLASVLAGAGCPGGRMHHQPQKVRWTMAEVPMKAPEWIPFNAPQAEIALPAFLVGAQGELSSSCWVSAAPHDVTGASTLLWEQDQKKEFDAHLRATFEKYLVTAGLDASLASSFTEHWTLDASELSYARVDAADIRPNFSNVACTTLALAWFVDGRFVVTEAVKAKKISIKARSQLSAEQKAKLDAAIDQINSKFHADFSHLASHGEELEIVGENLYIGGIGTSLTVQECRTVAPFGVVADETVDVCGGKYKLRLTPATVGNRYTLAITPADGTTASFDNAFDEQTAQKVDDLRLVRALVRRRGATLEVENLSIFLVGASGGGG